MKLKKVKNQSAKALANVSLKLGKMSADSACCYIYHQPKIGKTDGVCYQCRCSF